MFWGCCCSLVGQGCCCQTTPTGSGSRTASSSRWSTARALDWHDGWRRAVPCGGCSADCLPRPPSTCLINQVINSFPSCCAVARTKVPGYCRSSTRRPFGSFPASVGLTVPCRSKAVANSDAAHVRATTASSAVTRVFTWSQGREDEWAPRSQLGAWESRWGAWRGWPWRSEVGLAAGTAVGMVVGLVVGNAVGSVCESRSSSRAWGRRRPVQPATSRKGRGSGHRWGRWSRAGSGTRL